MAKWEANNVVVNVDLKTKLPLDKIASKLEDATYDPEQFPGLIFRTERDQKKVTILMFNSGKMVVTGLKSIKEAKEYVEYIRKILKEIGIETPKDYNVSPKNYVVNGKFDYDNIDVSRMLEELEAAEYNPEQFPGVIVKYKKDDIKVYFLNIPHGKLCMYWSKDRRRSGLYYT
ncbi:MAG: hypothetical protein QW648_04185 [Nanoarchaeales archaeon]